VVSCNKHNYKLLLSYVKAMCREFGLSLTQSTFLKFDHSPTVTIN